MTRTRDEEFDKWWSRQDNSEDCNIEFWGDGYIRAKAAWDEAWRLSMQAFAEGLRGIIK